MNKKRIAALILTFVFVFVLTAPKSNADPVTPLMFGTAAFSVANAAGFSIFPSGAAANTFTDYIESSVNKWLGGQTIADKIGDAVFSVVAGKLIIPATIYTAIMNFLDNFKTSNNITEGQAVKNVSFYAFGLPVYLGERGNTTISEYNAYNTVVGDNFEVRRSGRSITVYWNGTKIGSGTQKYANSNGWCLGTQTVNTFVPAVCCPSYEPGSRYGDSVALSGYDSSLLDVKAGIPIAYNPETVEPGYQWEGTAEWTTPDTNLDQLMSGLQQDLINNDINLDTEVTEAQPVPTPVPTIAPGDIDGYWNRQSDQLEGLGQDINDLSQGLDNLGEQVASQSQTLDNIRTETQAQTQALEGVQEGVSSIEGTLEDALATPDSEDLPSFKFDLRELFPFCIPFDIYRLLSSFDATPTAPHVRLPIVIPSIGFNYTLDLDFSSWDPVAQAMRTAELIVYGIALAWATGKVIKW